MIVTIGLMYTRIDTRVHVHAQTHMSVLGIRPCERAPTHLCAHSHVLTCAHPHPRFRLPTITRGRVHALIHAVVCTLLYAHLPTATLAQHMEKRRSREYQVLEERMSREQAMRKVAGQMEVERALMGKGRRQKVRRDPHCWPLFIAIFFAILLASALLPSTATAAAVCG